MADAALESVTDTSAPLRGTYVFKLLLFRAHRQNKTGNYVSPDVHLWPSSSAAICIHEGCFRLGLFYVPQKAMESLSRMWIYSSTPLHQ